MADPRKKFRQMVSLKKKRYQDDEFDLDLAYITERIIAFGFPSEGREAMFRNPMEDCVRFFDTKHKDHYYVYNLCIEKDRQYKSKKFHGRVAKYQFADHNAPPLEMIPQFCDHAAEWLNKDPENIIAVHCKAGKGRTGVMISCLLMYMNDFSSAEEAMKFYGEARTHNGAGVTIPSQRRFINYYERVLKDGLPAKHEAALFKNLVVENISNFDDIHFGISVESNGTLLTYKKKGDSGLSYYPGEGHIVLDLGTVPVSGNTKVTLYKPGKKKEPMCWFWFHCAYIQKELRVTKKEIDKAVGDKQHKIFLPEFSLIAHFEEMNYNNNNNNNNNNSKSGSSNVNNSSSNVLSNSNGNEQLQKSGEEEEESHTDTEEEEDSESEKIITKLVKTEVNQLEESEESEDTDESAEKDTLDDDDDAKEKQMMEKEKKSSSLITINLPLFKKRNPYPKKKKKKEKDGNHDHHSKSSSHSDNHNNSDA